MIVETDFLDHWKTQMLIDELGQDSAPLFLIRLWAHCQQRKTYRFEAAKLNPAILRGITRADIEKETLWNAFVEVGFLDLHEDGTVEAHGFYDANSQLCVNWENGKKGGRPKKKAKKENPSITQPKPIDNPIATHPEPIEEKEREEEKEGVEKQDEGEKPEGSSQSPSPSLKGFWNGRSYGNVEHKRIDDYADLHIVTDPIEAIMAVTGDYSLGMYGFLVKESTACLKRGMTSDAISKLILTEAEKVLGEIKAGEYARGPKAASIFSARMRQVYEALKAPKPEAKPQANLLTNFSQLASGMNPNL